MPVILPPTSTLPAKVALPVNTGLAIVALSAIALLTVVVNVGSSLRAAAISLSVFNVPGAESISAFISASTAACTKAVVAIRVVELEVD